MKRDRSVYWFSILETVNVTRNIYFQIFVRLESENGTSRAFIFLKTDKEPADWSIQSTNR